MKVCRMAKNISLLEYNEKAYEVGVDTMTSELINIEVISATISTVLKTIVMHKL